MNGDRFEREADRAADDSMRQEGVSTLTSPSTCADGTTALADAPIVVQQALDTPAVELDNATRNYFEPQFKHDFSRVKVHAGGEAQAAARTAGARAYTVGDHIVFGSGAFSPSTHGGRHLLAHELAHVVQQSRATPTLQCKEAATEPKRYSPSMPLDQALRELPNMPRPDALAVLKRYQAYIQGSIKEGEEKVRSQMELRAEGFGNYLIGGAIEVFGGATLPSDDWNDAWQGVTASYSTIRAGQIKESLEQLNAASRSTAKHWEDLNEYFEKTDVGVARSVTTLKGVVVVAAAVEVVLGAIVAAPVVAEVASTAMPAIKGAVLSGALALSPAAPGVVAETAVVAAPTVMAETAAVAAPTLAGAAVPTLAGAAPTVAAAAPTVAATLAPTVAATAPTALAVAAPATAAAVPAAATTASTASLTTLALGTTVVAATTIPSDTPAPKKEEEEKKRPPFVLKLPRQKAAHLARYRARLGVLQSDPLYDRGNPGQREIWNRELRLGGGAYAIDYEIYERGHALGMQGEEGEERIRIPDWSRRRGPPQVAMEVDHIVELQVTPAALRFEYNSMENFELLERDANGESGRILQANIAEERAKQVAFDPALANSVLFFDDVVLDGGSGNPERWTVDEIRDGEQLNVYEEDYYVP